MSSFDLVALSVDLEDPDVTKIRKEYEMYRLHLDNEMSNMQRRVSKFEEENKRLRAALQVSYALFCSSCGLSEA